MYQTISIEKESPPFGEFVTTIDKNGEHRVYRMNKDKTWTMRDSDGTNSPINNLEITHWLKKFDRSDFLKLVLAHQEIKETENKKAKLFGLKSDIIEILRGHTEIPQEDLFKTFNQIEKLCGHLDEYIKTKYSALGV